MTLIDRLKERKVVQWAIAYLAVAWVLLQVLDFLRENFGWSEITVRSATVVLAFGFFVVLVLAWYHGEKGHQRVGRVELLALAALVVLCGLGLVVVRRGAEAGDRLDLSEGRGPLEAGASIAVLPFENLSADRDNEYFSAGITDDIITQLAKIGALRVISRTSVMKYQDPGGRDLREIGRELEVGAVLEGAVRHSGDRIRINAQLIDTRTEAHLWAETYDAALTAKDIFEIQSDIARAIARELQAELTPANEAQLETWPTESLEAYDLYSRARYLDLQGNVEDSRKAIELFRRAIAVDTEFATAHARLGIELGGLYLIGGRSHQEGLIEARAAVERALELDPELASAHLAHGFLLDRTEGRYEEAEAAYRRAIELAPGAASPHATLGGLLLNLGRFEEARAEFGRAVELDPLIIRSRLDLALLELLARNYREAERQTALVLEHEPQYDYANYLLAWTLTFQDRHEEAIAAVSKAVELDPDDLGNLEGLAFVHARAGNRQQALDLAEEIESRGGSLKELAMVLAALGDVDRAFEYLERAYEMSPGELDLLQVDPAADPLRDDPRFEALLVKAGLKN